jgi:hypothetical protein
VVLPSEETRRRILTTLVGVKANGVYVNSLRGCVKDGYICSNQGNCSAGVCACESDRTGQYCEENVSADGGLSTGAVIGIVLGVVLPLICCVILGLIALIILVGFCSRRGKVLRPALRSSSFPFFLSQD